jgi:hypothetical protein
VAREFGGAKERGMVRRLFMAAAILAALTGMAAAQMPMPSISLGGDKRKLTPEEQARKDALDQSYHSAMQKIPEKKPTDPWGNIRSAPPSAANKP